MQSGCSLGSGWREQTIPPCHAQVWVRVHRTWRKGHVTAWIKIRGAAAASDCQIHADVPVGTAWNGRYMYDSRSIRPRYDDTPPTALQRLHVIVSARAAELALHARQRSGRTDQVRWPSEVSWSM